MKVVISDKQKKDLFVALFQTLKSCSELINLTFETGYLHIQGMDKTHICLYDVKLDNSWFNEYNVFETKNICFNSDMFYQMISTKNNDLSLVIILETDDILNIELVNLFLTYNDKNNNNDNNSDNNNDNNNNNNNDNNNDNNKNNKKTKSDKKNKPKKSKEIEKKNKEFNKYFKLALSEYDYEEMNLPDVDYDVEFSISSKNICEICSQLISFGNDISIKCDENKIDLVTNSLSGEMLVNINIDDLSEYGIVEGEVIQLNYSLIYIDKLCLTNKLSEDIQFSVSKEYPLKIKYDLGEDSYLHFYIAPKMID